MKKQTFNIHEAEGRRDGQRREGWLLALRYQCLRNMREVIPDAPYLTAYLEPSYETYKTAFLKAYHQEVKQ